MWSIEAVQRSRRYEDLRTDEPPPCAPPAPPAPTREPAALDFQIAYPSELFVPLADAPKQREPRVVVPSPTAPKSFAPAAEGRAPRTIPPPPAGPVHTTNPKEITTYNTVPDVQDVIWFVRKNWPQLNEQGARTLAAQFMAETASGKSCFDWNVGNIKAGPNEPHMYLRGVWEVTTPESAAAQIALSKGLAHLATPKEIADNQWAVPSGMAIVVFNPPHEQSRFRAFRSFEEGATSWLAKHQALGTKDPAYLALLNKGDTAAVAHALKQSGYYTAGEADYAAAMKAAKSEIDKAPVTP